MLADPHVLRLLAEVLDYPGDDVALRARRCARALAVLRPAAAERLERFAEWAEAMGPARLEESYTATFDLDPLCNPYVGHHLFGDGPARPLLLARLRQLQEEAGLPPCRELPDHVAEVLRLLAAMPDGPDRDDLARDGLAPAVEKMLRVLRDEEHPYAGVLEALRELEQPSFDIRRGEPARPEAAP